ncbi:MAG: tRNA dihydrouridine synthase DusB, partial [Verrucomicrobiae bacterium]|nr:tRNA dihydrouridine synthase DusB [Verrucomicrobiae bacterium]
LLNPWSFSQCDAELARGERAEPPTYEQRVDFMARHFEKLLAFRIERVACVQFRKVARWYGRALGVPKPMRHRLVMFKDAAEFRQLIADLRSTKPQAPGSGPQPHIPLPSGTNE